MIFKEWKVGTLPRLSQLQANPITCDYSQNEIVLTFRYYNGMETKQIFLVLDTKEAIDLKDSLEKFLNDRIKHESKTSRKSRHFVFE